MEIQSSWVTISCHNSFFALLFKFSQAASQDGPYGFYKYALKKTQRRHPSNELLLKLLQSWNRIMWLLTSLLHNELQTTGRILLKKDDERFFMRCCNASFVSDVPKNQFNSVLDKPFIMYLKFYFSQKWFMMLVIYNRLLLFLRFTYYAFLSTNIFCSLEVSNTTISSTHQIWKLNGTFFFTIWKAFAQLAY